VVLDYLKAPEIASVFADNYKDVAGAAIFIAAVDHFKIREVTVTIMRPDGTIIETGEGTRREENWQYVTTQPKPAIAGIKIVVKAKDRLGKEVVFEQVLN
jgi:hypothetical protein